MHRETKASKKRQPCQKAIEDEREKELTKYDGEKRETNHKKRSASSAVEFLGLASDAPYFAPERWPLSAPLIFLIAIG
jgi:hypothetical protein